MVGLRRRVNAIFKGSYNRVTVDGKVVSVCDVFEIRDILPGTGPKLISNTPDIVAIIIHYKCVGYLIIPKPNVSGREGTNSRCRRFDLLLFRRLDSICRRHDNMTAVVAVQVVAVSMCR